MRATSSGLQSSRLHCLVVNIVVAFSLLGVSGCGTFDGMSFQEREQANKDLASESSFAPGLKPERSLLDNHEVPAYNP
jgi:hypothetical protein